MKVIDEFQFIRSLADSAVSRQRSDVVLHGIGDDCAVLTKDADSVYLISTDCLVENIHFSFDYFSKRDLGHRALAVNLSDIAAMFGTPECVFVSLAIPRDAKSEDVDEFYLGLSDLAAKHHVKLAGGDTSSSLSGWFVNLTIVGTAPKTQYKLRSGAKSGDVIAVTGTFGDSALGLKQLQRDKNQQSFFAQRHRRPDARVLSQIILAQCGSVHAVMDVSDGLVQDVGHMMRASGVCAEIQEARVPVHPEFAQRCVQLGIDPLATKLAGGEDYELVLCIDSQKFDKMKSAFDSSGLALTVVGSVQSIESESLVTVLDGQGNAVPLASTGFNHFGR